MAAVAVVSSNLNNNNHLSKPISHLEFNDLPWLEESVKAMNNRSNNNEQEWIELIKSAFAEVSIKYV